MEVTCQRSERVVSFAQPLIEEWGLDDWDAKQLISDLETHGIALVHRTLSESGPVRRVKEVKEMIPVARCDRFPNGHYKFRIWSSLDGWREAIIRAEAIDKVILPLNLLEE